MFGLSLIIIILGLFVGGILIFKFNKKNRNKKNNKKKSINPATYNSRIKRNQNSIKKIIDIKKNPEYFLEGNYIYKINDESYEFLKNKFNETGEFNIEFEDSIKWEDLLIKDIFIKINSECIKMWDTNKFGEHIILLKKPTYSQYIIDSGIDLSTIYDFE